MNKLTLNREQRRRLFAGEAPKITGEGQCPVQKGYVHRLSSNLSFKVVGITQARDRWTLTVEVTDKRDPVRLLRRTPTVHFDRVKDDLDEYGYPSEPTPEALREAARDSAYTSAPSSLSSAGEAVDDQTLQRFAGKAAENRRITRSEEIAKREDRSRLERLRNAQRAARERGIGEDELGVIEEQVRKLERKLDNGSAAA